jgi:hypothetical protein
MLELGSSGSVRGVPSNGHPYRDPRALVSPFQHFAHPLRYRLVEDVVIECVK